MSVTLLDGLVLVVILISALLAMLRGFVREVLSIASWVAAAAAAYFFYDDLLPLVRQYVSNEYVSLGIAIGAIFFITLIIVSIITMKISDFVIDSKIGILDRTLGFVFGAARGLLLIVVAMLFFNFLVPPVQQPAWVAQARSKPMLDNLGTQLVAALPDAPDRSILDRYIPNRVPPAAAPPAGSTPAPTDGAPAGGAPADGAPATGAPAGAPATTDQQSDASYGSGARQGLNQLIQSSGSNGQ
jgi:membrane protein required for colicin V production